MSVGTQLHRFASPHLIANRFSPSEATRHRLHYAPIWGGICWGAYSLAGRLSAAFIDAFRSPAFASSKFCASVSPSVGTTLLRTAASDDSLPDAAPLAFTEEPAAPRLPASVGTAKLAWLVQSGTRSNADSIWTF